MSNDHIIFVIVCGLGLQVKPVVRSIGVQCSQSQMHSSVKDIGVQCSLGIPLRRSAILPYASTRLPSDASQSESEMSQGDSETQDLDTSAYTIQDDSSS